MTSKIMVVNIVINKNYLSRFFQNLFNFICDYSAKLIFFEPYKAYKKHIRPKWKNLFLYALYRSKKNRVDKK